MAGHRRFGVQRIGHGVNALEDQQLCDEIKRRSLALTVCPISNAYVSDSSKAEAIKTMLAQAMRVTVDFDDPAYFVGYMTENLLRSCAQVLCPTSPMTVSFSLPTGQS